jgi:site-specific DNA recombinase
LAAEPPKLMQIHPNAAEAYRRKIANLKAALADMGPERQTNAMDILRELVERIVIRHGAAYAPLDIEVRGRFAGLLAAKDPAAASATGSREVVVAGAGFEPATFRL